MAGVNELIDASVAVLGEADHESTDWFVERLMKPPTRTTDQPYFDIWGWRGDISYDNYWW